MKKIIYYVTDHGLGHATRSVALIRELQKYNLEIIVRNSNAKHFLKNSLEHTRIVSDKTDVGPLIKNDGISINETKSKPIIKEWIDSIEEYATLESTRLLKMKPDLIISDISPMPFLAAKKLGITSVAISNFTWYDVLKFLPKNQLCRLGEIYSLADFTIQLPFGTSMNIFRKKKKVGLVSRKRTKSKQQIKKELGIDSSFRIVLVALGGSTHSLKFKTDDKTVILSMNSRISDKHNVIDVTNWIEGQDLVSISDLVICKCGYGFVSECISNRIPFFYLLDSKHREQNAISKQLSKMKLGKKISLNQLNNLEFNEKFFLGLSKTRKIHLENQKTAHAILKLIEK
jgi:UDP-N-acetylglucosamine:LPS N-acetylglucosamine transferase